MTQISRLKSMLQPPEVRNAGDAAIKSAFIRKRSLLTASKQSFEPEEAHLEARSPTSVSSGTVSSPTTGDVRLGKVRLEATLIQSDKKRNEPSLPEEP